MTASSGPVVKAAIVPTLPKTADRVRVLIKHHDRHDLHFQPIEVLEEGHLHFQAVLADESAGTDLQPWAEADDPVGHFAVDGRLTERSKPRAPGLDGVHIASSTVVGPESHGHLGPFHVHDNRGSQPRVESFFRGTSGTKNISLSGKRTAPLA